jgi:hypothetical protein
VTEVVIENPVLNSPYAEPARYRLFDDDGITNEIAHGRRPSSYFVPIAVAKSLASLQTKSRSMTLQALRRREGLSAEQDYGRMRSRPAAACAAMSAG